MYIMHIPVDPSDENPGGMTLYIPGLTTFLLSLKKSLYIDVRR